MLEQKLDKISQENQNQVVNIKIPDVYPNGDQPRIYFDEDKIIALCESIKKHGVLQPIVVRPDDEGRYMIIAGERRYRASIMANKESIPAIIKDMPIKEVLEIALVENLQRENLNIIEEAKAYKNLIDKHKSTQEELAELVGRSRPYITNTMRLLNLSDEVKKYIELEKISPGHGKALLRVSNKEKQIGLAQQIIKENLSVRKTEEIIKGMLEEKKIKNKSKEKDIFIKDIEERLMIQIKGSIGGIIIYNDFILLCISFAGSIDNRSCIFQHWNYIRKDKRLSEHVFCGAE